MDNMSLQPSVPYPEKDRLYLPRILENIQRAIRQRSQPYRVINDMNYLTAYQMNEDNYRSYLRRRLNADERLVVTGTTRSKGKTWLSAVLNYNLEPNIIAFDKSDLQIDEIGKITQELVRKSREIERYDLMRPLIYQEGGTQGNAFVEELWWEESTVGKKFSREFDPVDLKTAAWKTQDAVYKGICKTRLIPGKKVYLGNIREFFIQNQPFVFTREFMSYEEAAAHYGTWERWKFVPCDLNKLQWTDDDYNIIDYEKIVEVVKYYDKFNNEFNIFLNAVMMFPAEFPLVYVSPSGEFPLVQMAIDPRAVDFAYSCSMVFDMMMDQVLQDDLIRAFVIKTQQSIQPPMTNLTGRALSRNIFVPGYIGNGIDGSLLKPLLTTQGVTPAEMAMMDMLRKVSDEKSISPVFTGDLQGGNQTATEIMELKKQSMMKLGLSIWGVTQFEIDLAKLRIANIYGNWTSQVDTRIDPVRKTLEKVYRTTEVDSVDEAGKSITRIIEFNPELSKSLSSDNIRAAEEMMTSAKGKEIRLAYIDPEEVVNIVNAWYITITPTEKDTDALDRRLFTESITEGMTLFGPQAFNMDYVRERWATKAKEDPTKLFASQQRPETVTLPAENPNQPPSLPPPNQTMSVGDQVSQSVPIPSIKELMR